VENGLWWDRIKVFRIHGKSDELNEVLKLTGVVNNLMVVVRDRDDSGISHPRNRTG